MEERSDMLLAIFRISDIMVLPLATPGKEIRNQKLKSQKEKYLNIIIYNFF